MHSKKVMLFALLPSLLCSMRVMADETIAQKSAHKYSQDQMDSQMSFTNNACGTTLTTAIEWKGFDAVDTSKASASGSSVSIGQFCSEPVESLGRICHASADGKAAIKKSLKKVVCIYGGEGKRHASIAGGTLSYTVDFKATGNVTYVQGEVANHI